MSRDELQSTYLQWLITEMSQSEIEAAFLEYVARELDELDDDEAIEEITHCMENQ